MRLNNYAVLMGFVGFVSLMGCTSSPNKALNQEKVVVSQSGDQQLACDELEPKLVGLESEVQMMLEAKQKRENKTFAGKALLDMTLAFLAGSASANNHLDRSTLEGFTQPEMQRINSLAERHHHLLILSSEKKCTFVPKVEERMAKYKKINSSELPAEDGQSYRKRITP